MPYFIPVIYIVSLIRTTFQIVCKIFKLKINNLHLLDHSSFNNIYKYYKSMGIKYIVIKHLQKIQNWELFRLKNHIMINK